MTDADEAGRRGCILFVAILAACVAVLLLTLSGGGI